MLTRTTLQMDGGLPSPSIALVERALKRVPGVLLANIPAAGDRAVVAHDAAVSTASLLAAAAGAGAHASILAERGAVAVSGHIAPAVAHIKIQRIVLFVAAFTLLQASIGAMHPSLLNNHVLLPVLLSCVWVVVIFSMNSKRRP